jgi:hypothetical protein
MIFLNSLFGYLCIAIIYKWLSAKTTDLYHVMIYMFLSPGGLCLRPFCSLQTATHCIDGHHWMAGRWQMAGTCQC